MEIEEVLSSDHGQAGGLQDEHEQQEDADEQEPPPGAQHRRESGAGRRGSPLRAEFEFFGPLLSGKRKAARCKHCSKTITRSAINVLLYHLAYACCCSEDIKTAALHELSSKLGTDTEAAFAQLRQEEGADAVASASRAGSAGGSEGGVKRSRQQAITRFAVGSKEQQLDNSTSKKAKKLLMQWICQHGLSFRAFDSPTWKQFVETISRDGFQAPGATNVADGADGLHRVGRDDPRHARQHRHHQCADAADVPGAVAAAAAAAAAGRAGGRRRGGARAAPAAAAAAAAAAVQRNAGLSTAAAAAAAAVAGQRATFAHQTTALQQQLWQQQQYLMQRQQHLQQQGQQQQQQQQGQT